MSSPTARTTDRGIGIALILGVLAIIGAGIMFAATPEVEAGYGFGLAMVFASLAVVAIHYYWD